MANRLTVTPEFAAVVARARAAALEAGELRSGPVADRRPPLPEDVRAALAAWRNSGDYERVVAEITADDPDLQSQ